MVSNTIKLSLGSLFFFLMLACIDKPRINNKTFKNIIVDTCKYYKYDARQIVSNLSCYSCHIRAEERLNNNILTFGELSIIDSLKLINYVFKKKHGGSYNKKGAFKTSKMDSLNECDIKNVIRYIKDYSRDIPMSSQ